MRWCGAVLPGRFGDASGRGRWKLLRRGHRHDAARPAAVSTLQRVQRRHHNVLPRRLRVPARDHRLVAAALRRCAPVLPRWQQRACGGVHGLLHNRQQRRHPDRAGTVRSRCVPAQLLSCRPPVCVCVRLTLGCGGILRLLLCGWGEDCLPTGCSCQLGRHQLHAVRGRHVCGCRQHVCVVCAWSSRCCWQHRLHLVPSWHRTQRRQHAVPGLSCRHARPDLGFNGVHRLLRQHHQRHGRVELHGMPGTSRVGGEDHVHALQAGVRGQPSLGGVLTVRHWHGVC